MKKFIIFLVIIILIFVIIIKKKYEYSRLLEVINNKKTIMSLEIFFPESSKIVMFNGIKKENEISVNNLRSILSIENDKIFYFIDDYFEEEKRLENFIVILDESSKKIIEKIKIPFDKEIFYIKKVKNKVYFSDEVAYKIRSKERTPNLYSLNLEDDKIEKLLEYDTEGLPIILEDEIMYSKEGKIYLFNIHNKTNKYIFDGTNPFEIEDDEIYYEENGKIVKRKRDGTNKKIIYSKKGKNRRAIKKINDNVYIFIRLEKDLKLPVDINILELIDVKNNTKINLNKIFSRENNIKGGKFYGLDDSSFIIYD